MKWLSVLFFSLFMVLSSSSFAQEKVSFSHDRNNKKIEVSVGGSFFTAFLYPDDMDKQVLFPIMTASGKIITRGYPLAPRPFERVDHPHHVGLWFNFGDVNKLDFWNNSFAIPAANKPRYGSIRFRSVVSENAAKGELVTAADWVDVTGKVLLNEESTYHFSGKGKLRMIERITRLTAVEPVTFTESKEGMLGLRVDRAFEELLTAPELLLDANAKEMDVKSMNNDGVNGVYRNAEGISGPAVWGTRSPWVALRAQKEGEVITLVMLDHPANMNFPAWYHARGYGLFAANNLGGRGFDPKAAPVKVVLQPGDKLSFKYQVVIGGDLSDAEIHALARAFQK